MFWQGIIGGEGDGVGAGANVGAMMDCEGFGIMVNPIEGGMERCVEIGGKSASAQMLRDMRNSRDGMSCGIFPEDGSDGIEDEVGGEMALLREEDTRLIFPERELRRRGDGEESAYLVANIFGKVVKVADQCLKSPKLSSPSMALIFISTTWTD